jgi:NADH-quinone oxidoreductase subunit J
MDFRIPLFLIAPLSAAAIAQFFGGSLNLTLFFAFATITVLSAVCVITVKNPVYAALFLVLSFFTTAMIWMLLRAEFLAIVLVLVYVGAVMVLFLFVVMMLDVNFTKLREGFARYLPLGLTIGGIMVLEMAAVLIKSYGNVPETQAASIPGNNTKALGQLLFTDYVFHVQVAAVILLVAMIAAISLTLRRRKDVRYNDPSAAVRVKAADRVRVVSIPSVSARTEVPGSQPRDVEGIKG